MKKPTFLYNGIYALLLLIGLQSFAQNYEPFTPRFDQDLRGDIVLIGNNILGPDNNAFNDNDTYNHTVDMRYIDIDSDASTYSSSSATLSVPNPNCFRIVHASLYWSAVTNGDESIRDVKLKGPSGSYIDVTGEVIYESNGVATGDSFPYACHADVTDIVTSLGTQLGEYTIANVSSAQGRTADFDPWNGTGYSAGWSLFVVYEDLTMPGKSITSFDGFSAISSSVNLDIPVSGFRTVPAPTPVRANFAFAVIEGDKPIRNDRMLLNGVPLSAADRDANNFFNSSVTQLSATPVNDRVPNSTNTLGFDTGVMVVPNPSNSVIGNNATSATIRLESDQDVYFQYFVALAVDIIEPKIILTKIVEDEEGNNIGGQLVDLGDYLNYVIGFQNRGNDNATETIIRDVLPINIIFNYPEDIIELPSGVTVRSYDPATREIIFDVDNSLVEENDPVQAIRFRVQVVESCGDLQDSCSNIITNQAFATYKGTLNPNFVITDDPSFSQNTGCLIAPSATNFLADLDCTFSEEVTLCGDSVDLTAANGYESYSWSTSPSGNPVIGTGQTITVNSTGTYYSFNNAVAPCQSIEQEYVVDIFNGNTDNPVIPYADEVVTCPNDGKLLPNIFLCGDNDSRFIETNITDSTSMIWEILDESSCDAVENEDCANEDDSCTWNEVATGPNYNVDSAGQYRLTINYAGGCFNQFYFNVYENVLVPTVTSKDITCETPGEIVVGGVPNGYEFSIDGTNYQSSNVFIVNNPGIYTVYIRQTSVNSNPCIFEVPDVQIRGRSFDGDVNVLQPLCYGDKGSVILAAIDAEPQYYYSIYSGGTLVNEVGPINESDYTFDNLNTGSYTVNITTEDGCVYSENIDIVQPPLLTVTAGITVPLSCNDGEITIYPEGGTPPYFYFINSDTEFQDSPVFTVTEGGTFDIKVVDNNNCEAITSITIEADAGIDFTVDKTDILCTDTGGGYGSITINATNANGNGNGNGNGNRLEYSINNGQAYFDSNVFSDLSAGDYTVVVRSVRGNSTCVSASQTITITDSGGVDGTAELTAQYTCEQSGEITVTSVNGGTSPYTYSIDGVNFQNDPVFINLVDGTYTVTIQDSSNCSFITEPITIEPLNPPTDLEFSNTEVGCPENTATVTITNVTDGVSPYEYQITAPAAFATPYQSSNAFTDLAPGTYTFQVRDANNCVYSENYAIQGVPTISVVGQTTRDVSCFNANDGSAEFTISGTSNFTYSINNSATAPGTSPIKLNNIGNGNYTILITDVNTGCTATTSISIESPSSELTATVDFNDISCNDSGSAIISSSGGWGGNSYEIIFPDGTTISNQSNNVFSGLNQTGDYSARVTDSRGCEFIAPFTLGGPVALSATINSTSDICFNGDGATIEVAVSGGEAPYEYSINGSAFDTENIFTDLIPGDYTIEVRDASGCTTTIPTESIADQLILNTVFDKALDCTSSPDASFTGTFSGGTPPYTYEVSFNGAAFTAQGGTTSPFTYTTSSAGTYQFQITDAKGCTIQSTVHEVSAITPPEIIAVVEASTILCNGDNNASIDINLDETVGTAPFTINVFNTSTNTDYDNQTTSLPAGSYTITITDANSCTDTETIVINEPDPLLVDSRSEDMTCTSSGITNGSVIVESVTGGTTPYTYYVTGSNGYSETEINTTGSTSTSFNDVDFGLYQINVVDANGCSVLVQDVVVASPPNDLDIDISTTFDCTNGGEAVVRIGTASVGSGPFFFSIYQGPTSVYPNPPGSWVSEDPSEPRSATFSNLTPGVTYTFIVHDDGSGCSYYETADAPIPTNSTLTADIESTSNITCTGDADGTVTFNVLSTYASGININYDIVNSLSLASTGITGTGTVPANGSLNVSDLGPLPFGNYTVLIEETTGPNAGCGVISVPFNITESELELNLDANVIENANCNPNSGVINAIASDGTAPYRYQISTSSTPPIATDANWSSNSTFNVDAGNYYIYAIDAYNCIVNVNLDVPRDPDPIVNATTTNECTATEGFFEIDVELTSTSQAPYSYSIDGGAFQNMNAPFTIGNLSSGVHTVEVKDANGCGNIVSVTIAPPIDVFANVTGLPSCTNDDGEITVNGHGGSGTYSYSISPNPGTISITNNVFSGVPSGTFTVTLIDASTGCSTDTVIEIEAATPVTFNASVNDVNCSGGTDGVITIELPVSNDNPIYTYEIIAPITVGPQNSNIFTGLSAGTYSVRVTSGRGCILVEDIPVTEPNQLTVSGDTTDFVCNPDNSASSSILTISEAGGTAPYSYSIDGTNYISSNTFEFVDNGSTQNINIYVKDANGCIATNTVVLEPLPLITSASVAEGAPIDCNGTGTITVTASGGSGNYSYQMLPDGVAQSSNSFNVTEPGDYYFQINDLDTGCYFSTTVFTVAPFNSMDVTATATPDIVCFGESTGGIVFNVEDYSGPYNFEIFDGNRSSVFGVQTGDTSTNPRTVPNVAAGNYTVVITQTASPFCSVSSNVITIVSPANELTLEISETSNVTCTNSDGTINAVASGGWGDYEYELSGPISEPYSENGIFRDLEAGTYTINVRDAQGCTASETITLEIPPAIVADVNANATTLSCFGDTDASIIVSNITGGQGSNYGYTLITISPTGSSSGPQASNEFNGLGAGTYQVLITDGFSCEFTSPMITITQPEILVADLVKESSQTCFTETTLTLNASGGTAPYEYSATESFSTILGTFTSSVSFDVSPGTYAYFIRDANGCITDLSNEIKVEPLEDLQVKIDSTNAVINCAGEETGVIVAEAQGGLGNYTYTLQDSSGNEITDATQDRPGVFTNLPVGDYQVYVESGDCFETSAPISILEPNEQLEVDFNVNNITCSGEDNGSVEINATGGNGVIKYAISPQMNQFFDEPMFDELSAGDYNVIVQDELGCYVIFDFTIEEPTPVIITITPNSILPEVCSGDNNGEFSISVSGGSLPYSVSLDDYEGEYTTGSDTQTDFDFTDLGGGDHIVYVRDAEGCESEWNITFPPSVIMNPEIEVVYECTDNALNNVVTVTLDDETDPAEVDYSLDGGPFQPENTFVNVAPGVSHYVDVRHSNGCIKTKLAFEIEEYVPLEMELQEGEINEIIAVVSGGSGIYEYWLNDESYGDTSTFIIAETGSFEVRVVDSNGCVVVASIQMEFVDICIPNYFTPNGDGIQDDWAPGCSQQYENLTFRIYDRYGRMVAELNQGDRWDGKYNGNELPTGDYWYVVDLNFGNDGREFVGHFTLYR